MLSNDSQFQIIGTKIYDPAGEEFIVKGINMFAWEGLSQVNSLINHWGFNDELNFLLNSLNAGNPRNGFSRFSMPKFFLVVSRTIDS